jgi:peptidoglycan/xylan/chitin deacetylase (PgdA/CDA1 family)
MLVNNRIMGGNRHFVKRAAAQAGAGLNHVLGSRIDDSLGILLYHRIAEEVPTAPRPLYNVRPLRFRAQLEGLLELGYGFWPLTRALQQHAAGKPFPPNTIVLTFDDGYESVFTQAWPILRELNIPATVFLATAFLDSDDPFPFDKWGLQHRHNVPRASFQPMTTEQCRELHASRLIELGAHTHTHQDFRARAKEFQQDLEECIRCLRRRFALDQISFSFPYGKPSFGYVNRELVGAAKRVGVTCGLTTEDVVVGRQADPFGWGRFNVYDFDTSATIAAKLGGWYSWIPKVGSFLSGTRAFARLRDYSTVGLLADSLVQQSALLSMPVL